MLSGFSGHAMEEIGEPKKAELVKLIREKYKFNIYRSAHALENVVDKLLLRRENSYEYQALMQLSRENKSITRSRRSPKKKKDYCTTHTDTKEKKYDLAPILLQMLEQQAESSDKSYKFQIKATCGSWLITIVLTGITILLAMQGGEPGGCFLNSTLNGTMT